jgi:polar amino acid transport system substrate-binding protein
MPVRKAALTLVLFLFLGGTTAGAEPVRFVTIDTAPWASQDPKSGRVEGVFPDIIAEFQRRTGLEVQIELQPFARIPRELENGRQDCTILVWNDQWAPFMVRGELITPHPMGVIARKGIKLRSMDDLHGLSVSVLRGLSLGQSFDNNPSIHRQMDTDYVQGLNKLAHSRLDAVAGALPTIDYLAKQNGLAETLGERLVVIELLLRFQCAKGSRHLGIMPDVDKAIRDMSEDGSLNRIKARWGY